MLAHDVVIVGAGPAGSSCAKALRARGIDVLILEKEALPRHKTCSGVLFGQTQDLIAHYFDLSVPKEVRCGGSEIIRADDILEWRPDGTLVPYVWEIAKSGKLFKRDLQNIWRNLFDKWLLDQSGARYREETRVTGFRAEEAHVRVRFRIGQADAEQEVRCKYLVGADGNFSVVRRGLGVHDDEALKVMSFQSYYKIESLGTLKDHCWYTFFLSDIGDILCCLHRKGEYLVLHVGGLKGRNLRESMDKFKSFLARQFQVRLGEWWRDEGCRANLLPPFLGDGRILVTGEAAGFMYLNGEGISAAIDSGYRCGQAIAMALVSGENAVRFYTDDTKDMLAHMDRCIANARFLVSQTR